MPVLMPPPANCLPPYETHAPVYISVDIVEIGVNPNGTTDRPPKAVVDFHSSTHPQRVKANGYIDLTGIKGCINITYNLKPDQIHLNLDDPPIRTWMDKRKPLDSTLPGDFDNVSPINISSDQSFNGWYHNPTPNQDTYRYYSIFLVDGGNKCHSLKFTKCEIDPIYHNGDGKQAPERNIIEELLDGLKFFIAYIADLAVSLFS